MNNILSSLSPSPKPLLSSPPPEPPTPSSAHIASPPLSPASECNLDDPEPESMLPPRYNSEPTIYQKLNDSKITWCRFCGTTNGVAWRPGPWGRATLCNKHGCEYKGYGFSKQKPKLDLDKYLNETISDRIRPVCQTQCTFCHKRNSLALDNLLVMCAGCPRAYHQNCHGITPELIQGDKDWFCTSSCKENLKTLSIVIEMPRRRRAPMLASRKAVTPGKKLKKLTSSPRIRKPRIDTPELKRLKNDIYDINSVISFGRVEIKPLSHNDIVVPSWNKGQVEVVHDEQHPLEEMDDVSFSNRHEKYEKLEKAFRIQITERPSKIKPRKDTDSGTDSPKENPFLAESTTT